MDEEKPAPKEYTLGDDIRRLSVDELDALRARLLEEVERVKTERDAKWASRAAADSFFR